jgi:hypothetical protein
MIFRRRSKYGELGETVNYILKYRGSVVVAVYVDIKKIFIEPKKSVFLTVLYKKIILRTKVGDYYSILIY